VRLATLCVGIRREKGNRWEEATDAKPDTSLRKKNSAGRDSNPVPSIRWPEVHLSAFCKAVLQNATHFWAQPRNAWLHSNTTTIGRPSIYALPLRSPVICLQRLFVASTEVVAKGLSTVSLASPSATTYNIQHTLEASPYILRCENIV